MGWSEARAAGRHGGRRRERLAGRRSGATSGGGGEAGSRGGGGKGLRGGERVGAVAAGRARAEVKRGRDLAKQMSVVRAEEGLARRRGATAEGLVHKDELARRRGSAADRVVQRR